MVRITISDLHPIGEENQYDELTDKEMKAIEGGYGKRRRRRGSGTSVKDPSGIVSELNDRFDNWLDVLNDKLGEVQTEIVESL
ncbi:bacteriocin [Nostoc sp. UIC 10890]